MNKNIGSIFEDSKIVEKIKKKLPYLFQLTEIDNSRDGKLGMEVGSARERIVIALLIYKGAIDLTTKKGIICLITIIIIIVISAKITWNIFLI